MGDRAVLLHRADRPEVAREGGLDEIGIGEGKVALLPPAGSPGVADQEALGLLVVADGQDGVPAELSLVGNRHRRVAGLGDLLALEALVDDEAEDEREARRQAALELAQ